LRSKAIVNETIQKNKK